MLSVNLSDQIAQELRTISIETGQSESFLISQAVANYLEELRLVKLADHGYADYVSSGFKTVSKDEMNVYFAKFNSQI